MLSGLDLSLDDLIKQSKSRPKASPSPAFSSGPTRRAAPSARTTPYPPAAPKAAAADSPYGVYSEHVASMATSPPPPAVVAPRALETGTKLHVSNLNASVTVEDVQELFSEIGELKRYSVNYDQDGKSQGSAEVVFARKGDALDAIERYNGVQLDGKPMKIELIGNKTEPRPKAPLLYNLASSNYNAIPNRQKASYRTVHRKSTGRGAREEHSRFCSDRVGQEWKAPRPSPASDMGPGSCPREGPGVEAVVGLARKGTGQPGREWALVGSAG